MLYMADICYEDETSACESRPSWSSRKWRIGIQRFRMSQAEMNPTATTTTEEEDKSEGIYNKRNKQEEYDFMNCASSTPSQSSLEESDVSVSDGTSSVNNVAVIPSKKTVKETDLRPRYGVASVCGRRRDMEDAVAIHPSFVRKQTEFSRTRWHYFGVYDGHGCSHVRCRFTLKFQIQNL